ncbi:exonuclease domain-containing protein [Nocardia cyriacigeorgica]|uniref:DNA polymerase III subunit epsilon n=1 Tax=Nocardia cyriacigeorgica TaxID=135487 RepID=A0A5R8NXR7_9NOCA|nr:exonuclease domain-containing protein [Nocardia cyriacigeorgica]TLF80950.1 DNA polymerase III subunit epsilon [Nocardia cyriacigeorgica]
MTKNLSFAAFDVETANPKYGSICSIGVAIVRNGERVSTQQWLCRPPEPVSAFAPRNIGIHKITPSMVADQPSFGQRWQEIRSVIGDLPVVAHNAQFDMGAVHQACGHSRVPVPTWVYGCTKVWAKRQLLLEKYQLKTVAHALEVRLDNHHDAGADATAAADIAIRLAQLGGADDLPGLARATRTQLGHLSPAGKRDCR